MGKYFPFHLKQGFSTDVPRETSFLGVPLSHKTPRKHEETIPFLLTCSFLDLGVPPNFFKPNSVPQAQRCLEPLIYKAVIPNRGAAIH